MSDKNIHTIYESLYEHYGPQHWWPAETPFEVMIGAILTQNTNWLNVEKAIRNLKPYLQPQVLYLLCETNRQLFTDLIRPCGYYNIKTTRVWNFLQWFASYDFDQEKVRSVETCALRRELLQVKGIGMETADSILLYAFGKPVFVVDAYTRRLFGRLGFRVPEKYDDIRSMFELSLSESSLSESSLSEMSLSEKSPDNIRALYNEYHALIVRHCKEKCKSVPLCDTCFLNCGCSGTKENVL